MSATASKTRQTVKEALEFISSKEKQLEYQKAEPTVNVCSEIFCKWDLAYHPEEASNAEAFSTEELEVLNAFSEAFDSVADDVLEDLPTLEEFMEMDDWSYLQDAAAQTLGMLS